MQIPCIKCKGRKCHIYAPIYFGTKTCPVFKSLKKVWKQFESNVKPSIENLNLNLNTTSPSIFVSRYGYPNISVGILTTPTIESKAWIHDNPRYWSAHNYSIEKIAKLRASLINSSFKAKPTSILQVNNSLLQTALEVAIAKKQTLVDVMFKSKPKLKFQLQVGVPPLGVKALVKQITLAENPKIPRIVEKAYYDYDLKAEQALIMLKKHFDEHYLTRVFSIGALGVKTQRKIVPTRWAITAVDDILAKNLFQNINHYESIDQYLLFQGGFQGNYFLILLIPGFWSFELFEAYSAKTVWNISNKQAFTTDYEFLKPRTKYAENTAGGYYAARIAVLEKLEALKKKATVMAIRFITPEYYMPLGVWVVREAARKALNANPLMFNNLRTALLWVKSIALKQYHFDITEMLKKSKILNFLKKQSKIKEFLQNQK